VDLDSARTVDQGLDVVREHEDPAAMNGTVDSEHESTVPLAH
jgi:hypothetical protein